MTGSARHVHFLGICGYAVSGAALLAQELGYVVTGSDEDAYPPTTDTLNRAGIPWSNAHIAENLTRWGTPDLVVVGNQVRRGNEEWAAAAARQIPITSEAEFYLEMTRDRTRIAVCGTHGKTTTAALLAHILAVAGLDPGLRLGSTSRDFGVSARLGTGPFVFEGDEYTTAPWDPRPKFLHCQPHAACVTRVELDHPDVYSSLEAYRTPFVELAGAVPRTGLLVLGADDPHASALSSHTSASVATYGFAADALWRCHDVVSRPAEQRFTVTGPAWDPTSIVLSLPGRHNVQNATAALALAHWAGAAPDPAIDACRTFRGPSRRFEIVGAPGDITVVDDYAHHPTEVRAVVSAARERHPRAKVIVAYIPHTYSRTLTLLDEYVGAFRGADVVLLGPIEPARERHLAHTVSSADVAARARHDVADVRVIDDRDDVIAAVTAAATPGDVVLCLSVRGFDGLAGRLVEHLQAVHVGT